MTWMKTTATNPKEVWFLPNGWLLRQFCTRCTLQRVMCGAMGWWCTRYGHWDTSLLRSSALVRWVATFSLSNVIVMWQQSHCPLMQVLGAFETGYCQPSPPGCPINIYKLMMECWWVHQLLHWNCNCEWAGGCKVANWTRTFLFTNLIKAPSSRVMVPFICIVHWLCTHSKPVAYFMVSAPATLCVSSNFRGTLSSRILQISRHSQKYSLRNISFCITIIITRRPFVKI